MEAWKGLTHALIYRGVNGPGVFLSVRTFGPPSLQTQAVKIPRRIKCSLTELPVERRAALST